MQPCPRQQESAMSVQLAHVSHWRDDGTCSYCGSLSPDKLFEVIAAGAIIGSTDKNYKIYVDYPDPNAGKPWIFASANHKPDGDGWVLCDEELYASLGMPKTWQNGYVGHWVQVTPRPALQHGKFYFQHLNHDEQLKFIELYNAKAMKMDSDFYVEPFFMRFGRQE